MKAERERRSLNPSHLLGSTSPSFPSLLLSCSVACLHHAWEKQEQFWERKGTTIFTSKFHLWVWWSITQLLRCRIDPGLSNTRLAALLISFLSFHCSSVVASIPKKKKKQNTWTQSSLSLMCLHRPRVSFLSESLTFPWHLPTFVIMRKRPDLTDYQKNRRKIKAVKCQMGAVHLAPVAPDLRWSALWNAGDFCCVRGLSGLQTSALSTSA